MFFKKFRYHKRKFGYHQRRNLSSVFGLQDGLKYHRRLKQDPLKSHFKKSLIFSQNLRHIKLDENSCWNKFQDNGWKQMVCLGHDRSSDTSLFACHSQTDPDPAHVNMWVELRSHLKRFSVEDRHFLSQGKVLLDFHLHHSFCSQCGGSTLSHNFGASRFCQPCDSTIFPRTDPAIISGVFHQDSILLARQASWPKGRFSCLAGFLEAGETIVDCVRREVFEEAGVKLGKISYFDSQNWPFPRSLMIGCLALAESKDLQVDFDEIEDAKWFSRLEISEIQNGINQKFSLPTSESLSHHIIHSFLFKTKPFQNLIEE